MKKIFKIIAIVVIVISILFIASLFILTKVIFAPTPEHARNNSVDGIKIEVNIDGDDRTPIIRTLSMDEYKKASKDDLSKIEDKTSGRLEGDIPCINLLKEHKIHVKFLNDNNNAKLDKVPEIEIIAHPSHYKDKSGNKVIKGELTKETKNNYNYEIERYSDQYEKYFLEYSFIKIFYTIDGKDYISLFSINSSNAPDGTDFFKNEDLEQPISPDNIEKSTGEKS